ncbi:MAG: site-specific DNA-methyltransferase, partial [Runella slithyformis]
SEAFKAGYATIADITQARIKKVIEKLSKRQSEKLDFGAKQVLGYRSYRLAASNFKAWRSDVATEDLLNQLEIFQDPVAQTARTHEAMLVELCLKAGLPLTVAIQKIQIADCEIFIVEQNRMWVALANVTPTLVEAATVQKPQLLVTLSTLFVGANADQLMTNTHLQLRDAGVDFRVI